MSIESISGPRGPYQVAEFLLVLTLLVLGHERKHERFHGFFVHRNINNDLVLRSANDAVQSAQQIVTFVHLKSTLSTRVMEHCLLTYLESKLSANAVRATSAVRYKASLTFFDQQSVCSLTNFRELFLEGGTIGLRPVYSYKVSISRLRALNVLTKRGRKLHFGSCQ